MIIKINVTLKRCYLNMVLLLIMLFINGCSTQPASEEEGSFENNLQEHTHSLEEFMLERRLKRPVPKFVMTDHQGNPFTPGTMEGKVTLLFFGYTHCPDFCPTILMELDRAYSQLAVKHPNLKDELQVVFVSADPFRDTKSVLAKYISYFNPDFKAVTGQIDQLYRLTKLMGVNYSYIDEITERPVSNKKRPKNSYVVNHSPDLYLFDENTRLITWLKSPQTKEKIVSTVERVWKNKVSNIN